MYLLQEKVTEMKCDCTYTVNILGVVYLFVYNYSYKASLLTQGGNLYAVHYLYLQLCC